MAAQGRERGEARRGAGEREGEENNRTGGALRNPLAPPAPRTDSDRLTDSAGHSERAGARARRRTKGPRAGGGAGGGRVEVPSDAGRRRKDCPFAFFTPRPWGGGEGKQPQRGVAECQAPPTAETEVGGGPANECSCGCFRVGRLCFNDRRFFSLSSGGISSPSIPEPSSFVRRVSTCDTNETCKPQCGVGPLCKVLAEFFWMRHNIVSPGGRDGTVSHSVGGERRRTE